MYLSQLTNSVLCIFCLNRPKNARSKRGSGVKKNTVIGIAVVGVVCLVGYAAATHKDDLQQIKGDLQQLTGTALNWVDTFLHFRSEGSVATVAATS